MNTVRKLALSMMILGFVLGGTGAVLAAPVVGDQWTIGNFCVGVDLEFMRQFTNLVVRGGVSAYRSLITTTGSPCFDTRHNLSQTINVFLRKKLWGFTLPDGEKLIMWQIEDIAGAYGYTWLAPDQKKKTPEHLV